MRKPFRRRVILTKTVDPRYADQKHNVPVVPVKPRNPELWTKDPRIKDINVHNDIEKMQREYVRSYLIDHASDLSAFHLTVGRQRLY